MEGRISVLEFAQSIEIARLRLNQLTSRILARRDPYGHAIHPDTFCNLLSFLDTIDLGRASSVCSYWRSTINSDLVWKGLYTQRWTIKSSTSEAVSNPKKYTPWKARYRLRDRIARNWFEGYCTCASLLLVCSQLFIHLRL